MTGVAYVRDDQVLWRNAGDSVVLLAPAQPDEPLLLGGSGQLLWALLGQPTTLAEMGAALADLYRVPVEQIASDVASVLDQLHGLDVVSTVGGP